MRHRTSQLTRRSVLSGLVGAAGAAMLAACGGSSSDEATTTTTGEPGKPAKFLVPLFAAGINGPPILVTGVPQRMIFALADDEVIPLESPPERLSFTITLDGRPVGTPLEVNRHGAGVPRPYYPVRTTFDVPGNYVLTTPIGDESLAVEVRVTSAEEGTLVQPGDAATAVDTPTVADARGVKPICTRNPPCPFHELNLRDALGNGLPTLLLIGTPAYCQTQVCGPVLELLVDAAETRTETLNIVHAEVYVDPEADDFDLFDAELTEIMSAYQLSFEPILLAIDAKGIVIDTLGFVWDTDETEALIALLS